MRETKDCKLELKEVNDSGTFEGYLSVYDIVDLGKDVVEKGAFTKTIQENKGIVPLLYGHDTSRDMGLLHLSDDDHGLKVRGEMFIEESPLAREKHAMAKRYHAAGRPIGLSIGFETIKKAKEGTIRRLKEVKLFEGSMTLFPMLPAAQLTGIKSLTGEEKEDFTEMLDMLMTVKMRYAMMEALEYSLNDCLYDGEADVAGKVSMATDCIDQFKSAYLDMLPKLLGMFGEKGAAKFELKAGRRISAASRKLIEEATASLQALLAEDDSTSEEAAKSEAAAAETKSEPEVNALHSWLSESLTAFKTQAIGVQ